MSDYEDFVASMNVGRLPEEIAEGKKTIDDIRIGKYMRKYYHESRHKLDKQQAELFREYYAKFKTGGRNEMTKIVLGVCDDCGSGLPAILGMIL